MAASATNVTCKTRAFGSASLVTEASAAPVRPAAVFVMKAVPAVTGVASWSWEYLTGLFKGIFHPGTQDLNHCSPWLRVFHTQVVSATVGVEEEGIVRAATAGTATARTATVMAAAVVSVSCVFQI